MTSDQVTLVRASWEKAAAHADALTTSFYAHLFEIDPTAGSLFAPIDMAAQRRKLAKSLAVVVRAIDDPDSLLPAIGALGKRHTHYGVEHHHFDSVGAALLAALEETLGAGFTPDVRDAWATCYALIAAVMRRALIHKGCVHGASEPA